MLQEEKFFKELFIYPLSSVSFFLRLLQPVMPASFHFARPFLILSLTFVSSSNGFLLTLLTLGNYKALLEGLNGIMIGETVTPCECNSLHKLRRPLGFFSVFIDVCFQKVLFNGLALRPLVLYATEEAQTQ